MKPDRSALVVGPYQVVAPLGAGGMGEVYRARDTKLGRDVAIKILPADLTADPERRLRFEREARTLATLSHPNIGAIYGLEEADGLTALVLELVEGQTLAERLERGPLRVPEALAVARQIAEALEAAHGQGIVHRDLKPGNIMLQDAASAPDGVRVKVLDFGIAKIADRGTPAAQATRTLGHTADGQILGTPGYMSPEQARGEAVDKRTDIWAFGCVLFEMLAGRQAFPGRTIADSLARVLEREPDWTALPAPTPVSVRALLERCLRKDPRTRLHDIADARIEIEDAAARPISAARTAPWPSVAWLAGGALAMALVALLVTTRSRPTEVASSSLVQFAVSQPDNWSLVGPGTGSPQVAMSPDGRQLAFVAFHEGVEALWIRSFDTVAARQISGTEKARHPFWSPDGRSIGFFADGKLKRVAVAGGPPVDLCAAPQGLGGTWSTDNVIVFAPSDATVLHSVPSAGGTPTVVTTFGQRDTSHRWPSFLPDGRHLLYLALQKGGDARSQPPTGEAIQPLNHTRDVRIAALGSSEPRSLGPADSSAVYASGHLLFIRGESLMAQRFDSRAHRTDGDPFPIAEVATANTFRNTFSASANGALAYSRGRWLPSSRLTWMDRKGGSHGVVGDAGYYYNLSLSPDERRLAVSLATGSPQNRDIWLIDLDRAGAPARLTFHSANDADPSWSPNGQQLVFNSQRTANNVWRLFRRPSDGSGEEEQLLATDDNTSAPDWSPDDRHVAFSRTTRQAGTDLWVLPLTGDRTPFAFLATPFNEGEPAFSPDGRWLAYRSNSSGQDQVHVRPFPQGGGDFRVSRDGGWAPRWRADGRVLFFLEPDGTMMEADIATADGLRAAVPRPLFETGLTRGLIGRPYAVTSDGTRFIIPVADQRVRTESITVTLNWLAAVQK